MATPEVTQGQKLANSTVQDVPNKSRRNLFKCDVGDVERDQQLAISCCHPLCMHFKTFRIGGRALMAKPSTKRETVITLGHQTNNYSNGLSRQLVHMLHGYGKMPLTNLEVINPSSPNKLGHTVVRHCVGRRLGVVQQQQPRCLNVGDTI